MDTVIIALRVAASLAVVLGMLWVAQRYVSRAQRPANGRDAITVVTRQGVSTKASVVMVEAGGKRLLLGVTEHSVTVLNTSETPPPPPTPEQEFAHTLAYHPEVLAAAAGAPVPATATAPAAPKNPFADLVRLATWRQAAAAVMTGKLR